jgi:hypothetical protein
MAVTACTSNTEYKVYSDNTPTIHPVFNSYEYSESLSGYTIVESIQCGMVKIGSGGLNS